MTNKLENFSCICGSQTVCQSFVEVDGLTVNQLYCPNCGIIMRSPSTDAGGEWLRKHWEAIIMRGRVYQKRMCMDCQWYKNKWQCTNAPAAVFDFPLVTEWLKSKRSASDYLKRWRCWLRMPSAEEMGREKWEE